jgi:glycosyltransferase involved in cell wall biosynthesis
VAQIVCVSKAIEKVMHKYLPGNDRITHVYSSVKVFKDLPERKNILRKELDLKNELLIGTVGALDHQKDHHTFIKAAKEIAKSCTNCHFVIIGDGPLFDELKALRDDLGLSKLIHFTGWKNNVHELLPDFDIFLFTSREEGLGTAVLDAFNYRLPVVSTDAGGITEMVMHRKTGLVSSIEDHEDLAITALSIINSRDLAAKLVSNATNHLMKFSVNNMADHMIEIYDKAALSNR